MRIKAEMLLLVLVGVVFSLGASAPEKELVALVGKRDISRALLDDAVNQVLNANYYHGRMTPERRQILEREQIQKLIRRELNILGAFDRGMDLPEGAAELTRIQIEGRLGKETYEAVLAGAGVTRKDHALALAETMLAQQAYEKFVLKSAQVGDEEIRTAFGAAPDHWHMPERTHLLHILLKVPSEADEEEVAPVRKQADSLVERLGKGEDFGALAAEFSQDMFRIKGGDLGWIHRGRLVAPLEEAVWQSDVGAVVGPVRSQEGFHLVKVLGRRPARPMEYAEAEPMLREQLEKQKLEAAEVAWFDPLREAYPVVIFDSGLGEGN
ncbi:MAG: peptidylprolyl isomerase [Thermoanaerobaculales bacterium]|nr:peptidylprolyl isomerase [Thermoanaerobaculales bacterium]